MVPPASHGIPRVPRYSGSCSPDSSFTYATLTLSGAASHPLLLDSSDAKCSPQPRKHCCSRFGLFRFRSPLLSESRLMSFPRATEMFQFARFASLPYVFRQRYLCRWVSPFGNPRITAHLPAPRGLSQAITSFVAYHRQGIHHMLLVT